MPAAATSNLNPHSVQKTTDKQALADNSPLPELREELQILPGSELVNGAPSWLIFDPVRHKYFQIGQTMFELLSHWDEGTVGALKIAARKQLERNIDNSDIVALTRFLSVHSLLVQPIEGNYKTLFGMAKAAEHGWIAWAIHHYLFFRIPLLKPQKFLEATKGFADIVASRYFVLSILMLTILGLYGVSRQWDVFLATFLHFISWEGAIYYAISLGIVKTAHELGHAYMAVRYKTRVNTIGIAFLVMMPVLYTDVSDSWRLRSRKQRLMIDCAGIFVELMLAGICTFLWAFLTDGPLRSICFTIATTSWLMSVALNLNPMMRFDGYYILSDLFGVPNLQSRAFAFGRWSLREQLFKLGKPQPEAMPSKLKKVLIAYAWSIWVYRATVFAGIAVLVYYMFFKVLGVILFLVEILWFLALPAISEMKEWWKLRSEIKATRRSIITASVVTSMLVLVVLPLQTGVYVPAILSARREIKVFTPVAAEIVSIHVVDGARVKMGDTLFKLKSPDIDFELKRSLMKLEILQQRVGRQSADKQDRAERYILESQLVSEQEKILGIRKQLSELEIKAPFAGVVSDIDPGLHIGRWINQKAPMAVLVVRNDVELRGYVREVDLERIKATTEGVFIPEDPMQKAVTVTVNEIAYAASEEIDIPYLNSNNGGRVAVSSETVSGQTKKMKPVAANYLVTLTPQTELDIKQATVGVVHLSGRGESVAGQFMKQLMKVLVRETGA